MQSFANWEKFQHTAARRRLNGLMVWHSSTTMFQHTAARRRLTVSGHAGVRAVEFQHTAARRRLNSFSMTPWANVFVSTHSRPKAADYIISAVALFDCVFQHTAARRRLTWQRGQITSNARFQHTAARRRLTFHQSSCYGGDGVSTHSRPKAAEQIIRLQKLERFCFNTQPPEGG